MKTTQAPSTIAVATPIEKVMSSVAKKSTTIRRTLDLPLAASIRIPFSARICCRPCRVFKRPNRAPTGPGRGKPPKNCGGKMAARRVQVGGEGILLYSARCRPGAKRRISKLAGSGRRDSEDHAPPHRHRGGRPGHPRQLRGRAEKARLRGERARRARRGDERLQDPASRSRRDR